MELTLAPSRESATPLYLQIAARLKEEISEGRVPTGEALPSERDLCAMTGASRVTVRKAIERLVAEGLLQRRQGSGTFVADRIEAPNSRISGFSDDARQRGGEPGAVWLAKAYGQATLEEAEKLSCSPGAPVARLGRVRLCDGEPLAVENAIVPKDVLPNLDDVGESLYAALHAAGHHPVKGSQRIRASLAGPTEAGLLSVPEHSEILRIERVTVDAGGKVVEYTRSAYRGDRYDFVSELT